MSSQFNSASAAGGSDPVFNLIVITPAMARQWLDQNQNRVNRKLRWRQVEKLVGALKRGEWKINGDAVRFDMNGNLIDGQHRLTAIEKSEISAKSLVIHGLENDSQRTMDIGAKRNFGDVLKMRGEKNYTALSTALRLLYLYKHNRLRYANTEPTFDELLNLLGEAPALRRSVMISERGSANVKHVRSVSALAHYLFSLYDQEAADTFFTMLYTGVGFDSRYHPILMLREWLGKAATDNIRRTPEHRLAMYVKAWNHYVAGQEIKTMRWRQVGPAPESFPEITDPNAL